MPLDEERSVRAHERTLEALMQRDRHLIDEAMDEHLSLLERFWEESAGLGRLRQLPSHVLREPRQRRAQSG